MEDNKVSVEGHTAFTKMAFDNDPIKMKTVIEIENERADIMDSDRCEAAFKIMDCGANAYKIKGISFDDW